MPGLFLYTKKGGIKISSHANRGSALEELVELANSGYRNRKAGVIHKVPSKWLPIRVGKKIVSAKITVQASVDFLGHIITRTGPLPIAFDSKEVSKGNRWPLINLEEHQYEYLRDNNQTGAFAFVLIGYWEFQRFYILPFNELERRWKAWKDKTGPASVRDGEPGLIKVEFTNYLDILFKKADFNGKTTASNQAV